MYANEYVFWKTLVYDYINSWGINYGVIGDFITSIDDSGKVIGSIDLRNAWLSNLSYADIAWVLSGKTL